MFRRRILCYGLIALTSSSCFERVTTTELAPVTSGRAKERPNYVVQPGDTLFSIAWKFDKDYKALAYYNGMKNDSTLTVGKRITLIKTNNLLTQKWINTKAKRVTEKKSIVLRKSKPSLPFINKKKLPVKNTAWSWPAKGVLSKKFTLLKQQKGIDIQGTIGSNVVAAQPGIVAYSGNGLRGYGNLVILRHPNNFLSAYAFNRKIFVKEGQKVKANQKIAEMGSRKGHKGLLHFEIRKNGQPINPLKYLIKH